MSEAEWAAGKAAQAMAVLSARGWQADPRAILNEVGQRMEELQLRVEHLPDAALQPLLCVFEKLDALFCDIPRSAVDRAEALLELRHRIARLEEVLAAEWRSSR